MNRIRKAEDKLSDTKVFRYTFGFMLLLGRILKSGALFVFYYSTEVLMVLSLIGMFVAVSAFESNAINYTICILFITILAVLLITLLKIKIMESEGDK
ncbi:MAG: hypothetical protein U0L20_06435 [Ruminococcus sp.]|nr:hypothetical protein [Ruminococcus sp.]